MVPTSGSQAASFSFSNSGYVYAQSAYVADVYVKSSSPDVCLVIADGVSLSTSSDFDIGGTGNTNYGRVQQTGGTVNVNRSLTVGESSTAITSYQLDGGNLNVSYDTDIGGADATFTQNGGTFGYSYMSVGYFEGSKGTYFLHSGTLTGSANSQICIGDVGSTGTFIQSGGIHQGRDMHVGFNGTGRYELSGGQVLSDYFMMGGANYNGTFLQTGGTCTFRKSFEFGFNLATSGTYDLRGGYLNTSIAPASIGYQGDGDFVQSGGYHEGGVITLGVYAGSRGSYTLSGGTLSAQSIVVSSTGTGRLAITNSAARLVLSKTLRFGATAAFTAETGSEVHFSGIGRVEIQGVDETAMAGLGQVGIVFEGGTGGWAKMEVAGHDFGPVGDGLSMNFHLGGLYVGGAQPAKLCLVDLSDNQSRPGLEALYAEELYVGPGSTLDLNGLHLYSPDAMILGSVINGTVQVPEPATLSLMAMGGLAMLRRRKQPGAAATRYPATLA